MKQPPRSHRPGGGDRLLPGGEGRALVKGTKRTGKTEEELEFAVRQIVNSSLVSEEVIDVFAAAGLQQPDISILSDDFSEVRALPHKNVAAELLRKLLEGEIRSHTKTNVLKSRAFSEMLDEALKRYRNRAVTTLEVIEELIVLAKKLREDKERGATLGLTAPEVAFYDALADNKSTLDLMGEPTLVKLAQELATVIRQNATIDWSLRESIRARLRSLVKRLLRKYKYPPDLQEKATESVLWRREGEGARRCRERGAASGPTLQRRARPIFSTSASLSGSARSSHMAWADLPTDGVSKPTRLSPDPPKAPPVSEDRRERRDRFPGLDHT